MRTRKFFLPIAVIIASCNQPAPTDQTPKAVTDIASENLKGNITQVETSTYLIDSATGMQGKLDSKSVEKYDDNGYITSYSNYATKDSATTVSTYERNANGFMTNITGTKNDKPSYTAKFDVDSAGKYTLVNTTDSTEKQDAFYDEVVTNKFGQFLSAKQHHLDSTLKSTFTNNYDSIYYVGGESKDSVGKVTYSATIKLNDKKDAEQMDETSVAKDSTTKTNSTYTYDKWDDKGNWTQQTVTENGKPKKIAIRIITYKP